MNESDVYSRVHLFIEIQWNHKEEMNNITLKIFRKYFFPHRSTSRHTFVNHHTLPIQAFSYYKWTELSDSYSTTAYDIFYDPSYYYVLTLAT